MVKSAFGSSRGPKFGSCTQVQGFTATFNSSSMVSTSLCGLLEAHPHPTRMKDKNKPSEKEDLKPEVALDSSHPSTLEGAGQRIRSSGLFIYDLWKRSFVGKASLQLNKPKMILSFWSSCLYLCSAGTAGVNFHTWSLQCWDQTWGLTHARQALH